MKIVITAGPAWTPIDGMRRVTNASTGRLGTILAEAAG
jgi:phosphopantothenoylcysteine synthetase/decarboxylase